MENNFDSRSGILRVGRRVSNNCRVVFAGGKGGKFPVHGFGLPSLWLKKKFLPREEKFPVHGPYASSQGKYFGENLTQIIRGCVKS